MLEWVPIRPLVMQVYQLLMNEGQSTLLYPSDLVVLAALSGVPNLRNEVRFAPSARFLQSNAPLIPVLQKVFALLKCAAVSQSASSSDSLSPDDKFVHVAKLFREAAGFQRRTKQGAYGYALLELGFYFLNASKPMHEEKKEVKVQTNEDYERRAYNEDWQVHGESQCLLSKLGEALLIEVCSPSFCRAIMMRIQSPATSDKDTHS